MKSLRYSALTALLALSLATPAAVAAPALAAPVSEQAELPSDASTPAATLTISPNSGTAGTSVTVRATCQPTGPATSEAFQQAITLSQVSTNQWAGTGTIRTSGLTAGSNYTVTVICTSGAVLTTTFTYTGTTPTGGAAAGFGGEAAEESDTQATALAIGGAVAIAGAVGYVFLSRRRRVTGNHL